MEETLSLDKVRINIGKELAKANRETKTLKKHIFINSVQHQEKLHEKTIIDIEAGRTDYTINSLIKYLYFSNKLDGFMNAIKNLNIP